MACRHFEFVILEASHLDSPPVDTDSFKEFLSPLDGRPVAAEFTNLGGDSTLVAPAQATKNAQDYKHIGSFIRRAPAGQLDTAWQTLAAAVHRRLEEKPQATWWVSTAGGGVAWLHFRVDPQPKYYSHAEYRVSEITHPLTFIVISSVGVWARSPRSFEELPQPPEPEKEEEEAPQEGEAPAEGAGEEAPEPKVVEPPAQLRPTALKCQDYQRRIPAPKFQEWKDIETQVLSLRDKTGSHIQPYASPTGSLSREVDGMGL
ncbi:unnamed protein product [Effrenium voratum]|nr:unnamed protein product [Effrenium voratum]